MVHVKRRQKKVFFNYFDAARDWVLVFLAVKIGRAGRLDWVAEDEWRSLLRDVTNQPAHSVLEAIAHGKTKKLRGSAKKMYDHAVALVQLSEAASR